MTEHVSAVALRTEVPEYGRPGTVRYARWDGGPLEVAKGILSGWYYLKDPLAVESTANWYAEDGRSLELLLAADINWIWVTFSNGFSLEAERPQREQLRAFVRRCHDFGIRVTAYASMCNVFIGDMRAHHADIDEWLQRDRDGKPIPYGAARYEGAPTRLLACLNHPRWRELQRTRVRLAMELGCDGYNYDNQWTECRCGRCRGKWEAFLNERGEQPLPWLDDPEVRERPADEQVRLACLADCFHLAEYEELYRLVREAALPLNPKCLIYGNFNPLYQLFTLPTNSAVSTENGDEPGIVDGKLVHNTGALRALVGAGAGWRPVRLEYGGGRGRGQLRKKIQEAGVGATRFVAMEPVKHQLSMAEAQAHGASFEVTPEGEFLRDLFYRAPAAMENWRAIAAYNRFFAVHEELYAGARTATRTVSLHACGFRRPAGDDWSQRPALLGALAERGVVLDVRYEDDLADDLLTPHRVMLLADVWSLSPPLVAAIQAFAERGGAVVATGGTGWYDRSFRRCAANLLTGVPGIRWLDDPNLRPVGGTADGARQANIVDQWPENPHKWLDADRIGRLADCLLALDPPPVTVTKPANVLYHLTEDSRGGLLVHLLNYDDGARPEVTIRVRGEGRVRWEWFSPDDMPAPGETADGAVRVAGLRCYGVLRLAKGAVVGLRRDGHV